MTLTEPATSVIAFGGGWWILPGPLLWLALIIGIALLIRGRAARSPATGGVPESGIDVLERRFAAGELSVEQYRERRSVLEENG